MHKCAFMIVDKNKNMTEHSYVRNHRIFDIPLFKLWISAFICPQFSTAKLRGSLFYPQKYKKLSTSVKNSPVETINGSNPSFGI